MRKSCVFSILAVASMTFVPFSGAFASADGMAHYYDPYSVTGLISQDAQFGLISYSSGEEKLAISIRIAESDLMLGTSAVWMFPVPAAPENVDISLISEITTLGGAPLGLVAESEMSDYLAAVLMSQVYTVPLTWAIMDDRLLLPRDNLMLGWEEPIRVIEAVAAQGMVAELVGTNDSTALGEYLESKGMVLGPLEQATVEEYVGQDYSFVVSWIPNTTAFMEAAPGVVNYDGDRYYNLGIRMDFPTDRIFYPMRLTSAYGDEHVPMLVEVFGLVSVDDPRGYDVDVQHMCHGWTHLPPDMQPFASYGDDARLPGYEFTRIWVDVESSSLEEDLWMDDESPMGADALVFATLNPLVVVLISFVLASMLASIIVAFLVFRPYGPRLERFALLAGLNFLSIIALWLALRNERVKKYLIPTEEPIPAPGKMLYTDYLIGFSLAFIALLILIPATFLVVATT
jgi:hypothetical protein